MFVYMKNKELYFFKINYAIAHCSEYILLWDSSDFYALVLDFFHSTFCRDFFAKESSTKVS